MAHQLVEGLERLLKNWDDMSKDEIKDTLTIMLPEPCPGCGLKYEPIQKYGRELYPDAKYDAASTLYFLCPMCKYVHGYTY